ncbi:hypothetical protein FOPG_08236 [Fusarium oxysporum f. sp. conglutinans race 2 54008]|uniref:Uncharacterized protein n=1 Tax=Fusarium oxysporum f. sp. conglutinans race 2 54008 TaxID=1089457 RepID=X0HLA1_FUSOX|nr:hypothetical protein FOPG_08236 [Fusarium oxysporum f. sp. conglutinans race 2 54008]
MIRSRCPHNSITVFLNPQLPVLALLGSSMIQISFCLCHSQLLPSQCWKLGVVLDLQHWHHEPAGTRHSRLISARPCIFPRKDERLRQYHSIYGVTDSPLHFPFFLCFAS